MAIHIHVIFLKLAQYNEYLICTVDTDDLEWGAISDLSLISDLSQKFKHDLWRVKSELQLSQKQQLTPGALMIYICFKVIESALGQSQRMRWINVDVKYG